MSQKHLIDQVELSRHNEESIRDIGERITAFLQKPNMLTLLREANILEKNYALHEPTWDHPAITPGDAATLATLVAARTQFAHEPQSALTHQARSIFITQCEPSGFDTLHMLRAGAVDAQPADTLLARIQNYCDTYTELQKNMLDADQRLFELYLAAVGLHLEYSSIGLPDVGDKYLHTATVIRLISEEVMRQRGDLAETFDAEWARLDQLYTRTQ